MIFLYVYCYNRFMAYTHELYYLSFPTLSTAGVPIWPPLTVLLSLPVSSWELFHCLFTCNYLYEVPILTLSRTIWPDILHCACCLLFIANNPPPATYSLLPPPCIILGASYHALPSYPLLWNHFKQSFNLAEAAVRSRQTEAAWRSEGDVCSSAWIHPTLLQTYWKK